MINLVFLKYLVVYKIVLFHKSKLKICILNIIDNSKIKIAPFVFS